MKLIDLTHSISPNMPVYPGTEKPVIVSGCTIEGCGFEEKKITFFSHTGTHMDAPAHLIEGGKTLDQMSLGHFQGWGLVLDCRVGRCQAIDMEALALQRERIERVEFLLIHTGWSRHWGSDRYFSDYPVLTAGAANWLGGCRLKGIGVDAISLDRIDSRDYPNHHAMLRNDTVIIENLTGLEAIAGRCFLFSAFPLKLENADGAPVRAVAAVEE